MKKLIYICLVAIIATSCDPDDVIFDAQNGQTLITFDVPQVDLQVVLDGTGSVTVPLNSTTISSTERSFNVSIVESQTTADVSSLTVGPAIIPANSHIGSITITGVDSDLIDIEAETLTLSVAEEGGVVTDASLQVNVFQICPVPETFFVGTYLIEQLSGEAPFASIQPAFGTQTVMITADGTARNFDFLYSPLNFQSDFAMTLNLVCNTIQLTGGIQSGSLSCADGIQIGQVTASTITTYDPEGSDEMFEITFTDFIPDGGCDEDPYDALIRFTKQ